MMDNEKIIRKKVFVYGAVQGVGFRYRAEHAANILGVTGWALYKNSLNCLKIRHFEDIARLNTHSWHHLTPPSPPDEDFCFFHPLQQRFPEYL